MELEVFKVRQNAFINYCYLLHMEQEALLVDPAWDYTLIEKRLQEKELQLKGVLLTHAHVDHVNLAAAFALNYGAPVYMSKEEIEFYRFSCPGLQPFVNMRPIPVGSAQVLPLLTPGHTLGSACYLAGKYVFTGDTLFIEGCGDCRGKGASPEDMFNSIALLKTFLKPDTLVYPGHSFGQEPGQPVAFLEKNNVYYQLDNVEYFVKFRMRKSNNLFSFE